jgi:hypothetical protein
MSSAEHHRQLVTSLRLHLVDLDELPDVRPGLAVLCEMAVDRLLVTCPDTAAQLGAKHRLAEVVAALLAHQVVDAERPANPDEFDRHFLQTAITDPDAEVRAAATRELDIITV